MKRERPTIERIAEACTEATGVTLEQLRGYKKNFAINTARGCLYIVANRYGIHPTIVANYLHRDRSSVIVTTGNYNGYYDMGDTDICFYVNAIEKKLND